MAINKSPYNGEMFCDTCGEVFKDVTMEEVLKTHHCEEPEAKSKDNKGNPELMFTQQQQIDAMLDEIQTSEDALNDLVDAYSEASGTIASFLAGKFDQAQKETKKSAGMDVFMLWAASKSGNVDAYKTFITLGKKAEIHSKILESKGRRLSGLQTKTKLNDWRK